MAVKGGWLEVAMVVRQLMKFLYTGRGFCGLTLSPEPKEGAHRLSNQLAPKGNREG